MLQCVMEEGEGVLPPSSRIGVQGHKEGREGESSGCNDFSRLAREWSDVCVGGESEDEESEVGEDI